MTSNVVAYYDKNNFKKMELYYESNIVTQVRLFFTCINNIKNNVLIISEKHFKDKLTYFHEKHYMKEGKKYIEYYTNNVIDSYFEIEKTNEFKITKGFSPNGKMFSREKIEYNIKGKAITEEQLIFNADGTKLEYKINL